MSPSNLDQDSLKNIKLGHLLLESLARFAFQQGLLNEQQQHSLATHGLALEGPVVKNGLAVISPQGPGAFQTIMAAIATLDEILPGFVSSQTIGSFPITQNLIPNKPLGLEIHVFDELFENLPVEEISALGEEVAANSSHVFFVLNTHPGSMTEEHWAFCCKFEVHITLPKPNSQMIIPSRIEPFTRDILEQWRADQQLKGSSEILAPEKTTLKI